jgi:hypothetical protein
LHEYEPGVGLYAVPTDGRARIRLIGSQSLLCESMHLSLVLIDPQDLG